MPPKQKVVYVRGRATQIEKASIQLPVFRPESEWVDFTGRLVNLDGTDFQVTRTGGRVSGDPLKVKIPYFDCTFQKDVKWGTDNFFTTKLPKKQSNYEAAISIQFPGYQPIEYKQPVDNHTHRLIERIFTVVKQTERQSVVSYKFHTVDAATMKPQQLKGQYHLGSDSSSWRSDKNGIVQITDLRAGLTSISNNEGEYIKTALSDIPV